MFNIFFKKNPIVKSYKERMHEFLCKKSYYELIADEDYKESDQEFKKFYREKKLIPKTTVNISYFKEMFQNVSFEEALKRGKRYLEAYEIYLEYKRINQKQKDDYLNDIREEIYNLPREEKPSQTMVAYTTIPYEVKAQKESIKIDLFSVIKDKNCLDRIIESVQRGCSLTYLTHEQVKFWLFLKDISIYQNVIRFKFKF